MMYYITDENDIPQELIAAKAQGKTIQVLIIIGYIDIEEPEFRCGANYQIKEE